MAVLKISGRFHGDGPSAYQDMHGVAIWALSISCLHERLAVSLTELAIRSNVDTVVRDAQPLLPVVESSCTCKAMSSKARSLFTTCCDSNTQISDFGCNDFDVTAKRYRKLEIGPLSPSTGFPHDLLSVRRRKAVGLNVPMSSRRRRHQRRIPIQVERFELGTNCVPCPSEHSLDSASY